MDLVVFSKGRKAGKILVISILLVFCFFLSAYAFEAKVVKVYDGDTATVISEDGRKLKIRLFGIDAPERDQDFGKKSGATLSRMINRKEVEIDVVAEDKYGRLVGIIYLGKRNINEEMVKKGLAWVYRRYCNRSECERFIALEDEARVKRKGLWDQSDPVAPWDYRRDKKKPDNDFFDIFESYMKKLLK